MPLSRQTFHALALAVVVIGMNLGSALAEGGRIYAPGGIALGGYDPVTYFTQGKAVAGKSAYALKWHGAVWYFDSAEAMEAFEMDPKAYAPQYGGYCAFGAALGLLTKPDPEVFTIYNGRLYLISSGLMHKAWSRDIEGNVARADANWHALSNRR